MTLTTPTTTYPWRPDSTAFAANEVVNDALIMQTSTIAGSVDGDQPAVRVAFVDDADSADYVDEIDYGVDPAHRAAFFAGARRFLPFLGLEDLAPVVAGIRPKRYRSGEPVADFIIRDEADRGLPGLIDLIGIESPGLTACLAIAEAVEALVR